MGASINENFVALFALVRSPTKSAEHQFMFTDSDISWEGIKTKKYIKILARHYALKKIRHTIYAGQVVRE